MTELLEMLEAALAAERRGEPDAAGALYEALGHALLRARSHDAAADAFAQAARVSPDHASRWFAFGNACMEAEHAHVERVRAGATSPHDGNPGTLDRLERAMLAFERAAELEPANSLFQAHRAMAAGYGCDASRSEAALSALRALYESDPAGFRCTPLMAVALLDDAHAQRTAIAHWSAARSPITAAPALIKRRGTPLRVGYLSSDFHDHATAHLAAGLFDRHDRDRFETFAYAYDRDDGSAMRARLRGAFAQWRDVRELPDEAAARRISEDSLDVLVDLKGHTQGARIGILAHRPAPVQIHYLGFPGTLACAGVDGIVADAIVAPPGSEGEFGEAVLRLPRCYQVNDDRRRLPPPVSRASQGLPERGLVLASFNQTYKLTTTFFDAWMEALRAYPRAVLWLLVPHALSRHNLGERAVRAGIAPERIVFAPLVAQAEHIARLRCADLALDVLPYGSHTTGSDALWAGVPLLACRGGTFAGRVGASLCDAVALPELVQESPADYASALRDLCAEPSRLAHYREHLETKRHELALFDTQGFTRDFERLLEDAAGGSATSAR